MMMALSLLMIKNPQAFTRAIITFSQQRYFHIFEIISRLFLCGFCLLLIANVGAKYQCGTRLLNDTCSKLVTVFFSRRNTEPLLCG